MPAHLPAVQCGESPERTEVVLWAQLASSEEQLQLQCNLQHCLQLVVQLCADPVRA